jgi:predicted small lipoprotein YifL
MLVLAAGVCALSACGQQGPLYLPDAKMPHGKAVVKSQGKTPALPPASAEPAEPAHIESHDSDAIVPVTPSIPD